MRCDFCELVPYSSPEHDNLSLTDCHVSRVVLPTPIRNMGSETSKQLSKNIYKIYSGSQIHNIILNRVNVECKRRKFVILILEAKFGINI